MTTDTITLTRCPRCLKTKMRVPEVHNALSRRDNQTYICSDCGVEEAFIDAGLWSLIPKVAIKRDSDFVAKLARGNANE